MTRRFHPELQEDKMHLHPHSIRSGKSVREQFEREHRNDPWVEDARPLTRFELFWMAFGFGVGAGCILAWAL